jgi:LppX_LprAFG lipoprotein
MTRRSGRSPVLVLALGLLATWLVAACGGATGSPSATPTVTAAVDTPAPTEAPPSEAVVTPHSPSLEPPADAGDPFAEALVAALGSDPLAMHLEQVATATTPVGEIEATLSGDFSGPDLDITMHITTPAGDVDTDMIVLGETAYIREGGGAWQSAPRATAEASLAGLLQNMRLVSDPQDLRYVGPETVDGRELHHLTASRTIPYEPAAGGSGQYDVFDIWVEEDGTPVLAKTAFSAQDVSGIAITGTTNFEFSNFGEPVEIVAPAEAS